MTGRSDPDANTRCTDVVICWPSGQHGRAQSSTHRESTQPAAPRIDAFLANNASQLENDPVQRPVTNHMTYAASRCFLQPPFQPCAAEKPNGEVCGGQHGDHPKECALGRLRSIQVFKTAKHPKTSHHEYSTGDTVRHQGSTIGNDLRRKIQLILRHWFAFA